MALEEYQNLLFEKVKKQMTDWFNLEDQQSVEYDEVYRFLHSIVGTAGTVQLGGLFLVASKLMVQLETYEKQHWNKNELRDLLFELVSLSYEYEHFKDTELKREEPNLGNIPLVQIIDDDVSMLILMKEAMEANGWMVIANTEPEKAISQYYDFHPDCLVINLDLQQKMGFKMLANIQQHNHKQFIPMVITSTQNDRDTRMNAYKMGADDFMEKPIDIEEFIVRINRQLQRKETFDHSVMIDELTQVYNRRFLFDMLERTIKDFERSKIAFSIALLDLDFFKEINDTYGHLTGDRVLENFGSFLKENIRSADTVFRYGGEEFVILFPKTTDEEAKEVLTRILNDFSKIAFHEQEEIFHITFSAGVYMASIPGEGSLEILRIADEALYEAKDKGRARVESANQTMKQPNAILNVSVIDDDAIIRTVLVRILENMVVNKVLLNIESYDNGEKFFAADRLAQKGKHFLILDGVMPVMDGIEVLNKVKQTEHSERVHVLMLTGKKTEYDIARALKLGADDYVTKPFSITELQTRIHRLIQRMI